MKGITVIQNIKLNEIDNFINYKVWVKENDTYTLIYIGVCRHTELLKMPDFRLCRVFNEVIKPDEEFRIELLPGSYVSKETAQAVAITLIELFKPFCNVSSGFLKPTYSQQQVKCVTDGKVYQSARAAAMHYGIHPGNMSAHLRGRKNGMLKKMEFRYV